MLPRLLLNAAAGAPALLLALLAVQAASGQPLPSGFALEDGERLLAIKATLPNTTWLSEATSSWLPGTDPCVGSIDHWKGITCRGLLVHGM
jgi:hypothetical protein